MKNSEKQIFEIIVWYRFVCNGEQEKEMNDHKIEATSIQDAVNKANDLYKSLSAIPFHFSHNGKRYEPQSITKMDMYNLTSPILNI